MIGSQSVGSRGIGSDGEQDMADFHILKGALVGLAHQSFRHGFVDEIGIG